MYIFIDIYIYICIHNYFLRQSECHLSVPARPDRGLFSWKCPRSQRFGWSVWCVMPDRQSRESLERCRMTWPLSFSPPKKKSPENYIWIQHDDFKKAMFFYETWQFEKLMQCIKKPLPGQESESLFEALAWGLPRIWWSRQPSRCFATFHISRYLMMIYLDTPCNL